MLQEKLELLLDKYAVAASAKLCEKDGEPAVEIDGTVYPILAHRFERRFTELRKMLGDGTLTGLSAVRGGNVQCASVPLWSSVRREIDLCRYLCGEEPVSIAAYAVDRAVNLIVNMPSGVVCTLEVASALPEGSTPIDKHELIGARGFICDRVVDTQVPQQSIYLYADETETYTDVDFELFGLSQDQVALVRTAFALAKDATLREKALDDAAKTDRIVEAARKSAADGKKVTL